MTVALQARARASGTPTRATLALAVIEGRRLVLHPMFLTGVGFGLFVTVAANGGSPYNDKYTLLTGLGLLPTALGTLLAANLVASRSRRSRTEELFASAPLGPANRTAAHLIALVWPVAVSLALLAIEALVVGIAGGLPVHFESGARLVRPSLIELAQGPSVVTALGALGVALALWVPAGLAVVPLIVVGFFGQFLVLTWTPSGSGHWFTPMTHHFEIGKWVDTPGGGYSLIRAIDVASMGWHVLYLAGLTALFAILALLRHGRTRSRVGAAVVGLAATAVGAILQIQ